jgi:hypothetical protein
MSQVINYRICVIYKNSTNTPLDVIFFTFFKILKY